jgi:hypothetical protein
VPELPRDQEELSPMVRFVRDEVRKDVAHIEREIAPDIPRGRRELPAPLAAKGQQSRHAAPALPQGPKQGGLPLPGPLEQSRYLEAQGLAQGAKPSAPTVVEMHRHHPDGASWISRDGSTEQRNRQGADELRRHPGIGVPGGNYKIVEVTGS